MAETTKASASSTGEGNAVRREANKFKQDVDGIKTMLSGNGLVKPGMSMPDIQGSQFDNPEAFDDYKTNVNDEVNQAAHLKDRYDERQIDWDLTDRKDLDDDGVTSKGVRRREQREFTRTKKDHKD